MHSARALSAAIVLVMVGALFVGASLNVDASESARDSYGYRYTDSNAPPPTVNFNWVDINTTGTDTGVSGDDSYFGPYPIGFSFDFYGTLYTQFYISTNCLISFGSGSSSLSNTYIPNTNSPNAYIAAYWDDMYVRAYSHVTYELMGADPTQQLVVEFANVTRYGGSTQMTFEIILNQTGDVWIQYLALSGNTGTSATVGIEGLGGSTGVEYSYNTGSLSNNLAIKFSIGPIYLGPDTTLSGNPGSTIYYNISLVNLQAINDTFEITNATVNGWAVEVFNESLVALTDTDGDTVPDTGEVVVGGRFNLTVLVTIPASPSTQTDIVTVTATSHADSMVYEDCTLTAELRDAYFNPPHSDHLNDSDGDGLYNYVVVDVEVYAWVAGWYTVQGTIYTPTNDWIQGIDNGSTYLTVGPHTIGLYFYGWVIRQYAEDGPYRVALTLRDGSWTAIDTGEHFTGAYAYAEFTSNPSTFDPPHSDYVINTDADALYEYLAAVASIDCVIPGDYYVTGYLYDNLGNYIGAVTNYTTLSLGAQNVEVRFDGQLVELNGVDGTFTVYFYLYFYAEDAYTYIGADTHTTASYDFADFEPYPAHFELPVTETAVDLDADTLYDYLVINVPVNVSVAGTYIIEGELGEWWDVIDTQTNTTYLTVGLHTVQLVYPGWRIWESGETGPYDLELTITDDAYNYLDWYDYTTGSYSWNDFDPTPAQFSSPHNDYGLDVDSDGLYEWLVLEALVDVDTAGTYRVYAELQTWWGSYIEEDETTTYLDVDIQTVELRFEGWIIRASGQDGSYDLYLELYTEDDELLDTDTDSTGWYDNLDFDDVPVYFSPPYYDVAVDNDADSLYDWLAVEVNFTANQAMNGVIKAVLYDSSWNIIDDYSLGLTIGLGFQTVDLIFDAWLLGANNVSGVFHAYFDIYDSEEHMMDSDSYTTQSYDMADFEDTVPVLISSWSRTDPTIDGTFSVGEWSQATAVVLETADAVNDVAVVMYVMNDATNLYVCYDVRGDTTMDSADSVSIGFDVDGDDALSHESEDEFVLGGWVANWQAHYEYNSTWSDWRQHCTPLDDTLPDHAGLEGAMGFGASDGLAAAHRIFEYSIPLALINATAGDTLGFIGASDIVAGVYDASTTNTSSWPVHRSSARPVATYGDLRLATYTLLPAPTTTATLSGTTGTNNWFHSSVSVTLGATGGEGGVAQTQYRLDAGSWTTYTVPFTVSGEGTHTVEYRSQDNADQWEATKTVQVMIDSDAPATTADVDGAEVTLTASDSVSGVHMIYYRIDGTGPWLQYTGAFTVEGNGTHTVEYYTTDVAGNAEETQTVEVDVDGGADLLSNPILWIVLIAAIVVAVVLFFVLAKRKKGQAQQQYQTMPPQGPMQQGPPPPMQ